MITDLLQIGQATAQHINCLHISHRLNAQMHRGVGWMRHRVSAKCNIGTEMMQKKRKMPCVRWQEGMWSWAATLGGLIAYTHYRQMIDFKTLPSVWPSLSNTNVREPSFSSLLASCKRWTKGIKPYKYFRFSVDVTNSYKSALTFILDWWRMNFRYL